MSIIFNENEYNSNEGMITNIWGPALWLSLHTISFNYPIKPTEEQKQYYYDFFINLKNILPCKYCRINYEKNLKQLPLTKTVLKNRYNFSKWLYNIHELVNKHLEKKSNLTYEDVRDLYEHFRSRCVINSKKDEIGCTEPIYGLKSKCTLNIVPRNSKIKTLNIDKKCKLKKIN
jgi:hypothetical protein